VTDDMTLDDAIALNEVIDNAAIARGTLDTTAPTLFTSERVPDAGTRDELMAFFGAAKERDPAILAAGGVPSELDGLVGSHAEVSAPTRAWFPNNEKFQRLTTELRKDQLLARAAARAADEAAALDALPEIAPLYATRADSATAPNRMNDLVNIGMAATGAGGLAYALSQMAEQEEDPMASQVVVEADMQPEQAGDPTGLAAAAEDEAMVDELEDAIADIGEGAPIGSEVPPGETMGADYLRELMAGFDDRPSDTADLVAESRPIPASTPVVVSQRTVYQKPRRTSRGRRRPNYAYSRARNPSQSRNRR
jgi:hypothetical protein